MKNNFIKILPLFTIPLFVISCSSNKNNKVRVVLLLGQSNGTGWSYNEYLNINNPSLYQKAIKGYENIYINYDIDFNQETKRNSNNQFIPVTLGMGAKEDRFGPEIGLAEALNTKYKNEKIYILKYCISGSWLDHQWLDGNGDRGIFYQNMLSFYSNSVAILTDKGYEPYIDAICWMQGEGDSIELESSNRYYNNEINLINYLREDFNNPNCKFIDAGLSSYEEWKNYQIINKAKEDVSKTSNNNYYFDTIELGFTTMNEPKEAPDGAHYDSNSEISLGLKFGEYIQ